MPQVFAAQDGTFRSLALRDRVGALFQSALLGDGTLASALTTFERGFASKTSRAAHAWRLSRTDKYQVVLLGDLHADVRARVVANLPPNASGPTRSVVRQARAQPAACMLPLPRINALVQAAAWLQSRAALAGMHAAARAARRTRILTQ